MKRNKKRIVAAVAVVGALAAGGAAFTDSLDVSAKNANAGYGSVTVNGQQNVSSIVYGYNSDRSQITSVHLTFQTAPTNQYVAVAFNSLADTLNGTPTGNTAVTTLAESTCVDHTTLQAKITGTAVDCTINTGGNAGAPTDQVKNLDVLVQDNPTS